MKKFANLLQKAQKIVVVQAENPDGDSIGSAVALEQILTALGKEVSLHCPIQVPGYLRYISGWDRISDEFDEAADLAIVVDTTSQVLLSKTLDKFGAWFERHPVLVLDHHQSEADLPFAAEYLLDDEAVATGEIVFDLAREQKWPLNQTAAESLFIALQADTLGLTTENVTAAAYAKAAKLVKLGVVPATIEASRRELMRKSPRILAYKGQLLERVTYHCDGRLALVHVPFAEIQEYSDEYNPTVLVLDEMRLVTGVDVAIGTKSYPDGKYTGKIRSNLPLADVVAGFFGGGGHQYAAGFRLYETDLEKAENELIGAVDKILLDYDKEQNAKNS